MPLRGAPYQVRGKLRDEAIPSERLLRGVYTERSECARNDGNLDSDDFLSVVINYKLQTPITNTQTLYRACCLPSVHSGQM
jgi:hypothetical protein